MTSLIPCRLQPRLLPELFPSMHHETVSDENKDHRGEGNVKCMVTLPQDRRGAKTLRASLSS